MRRLYFLVPGVPCAQAIHNELLLARIEEHHMHVIAREGTPMEDLPPARLSQQSDLIPALQRGTLAGGLTGVLAGIIAVTFPPAELVLGGAAVLGIGLAGAGFGALMSSMIGVSLPNSRLKRFREAIKDGELLMMVDVPKHRVEEVSELIRKHHPDVRIEGTEPTIPAFP